jgi:hypothetical protein
VLLPLRLHPLALGLISISSAIQPLSISISILRSLLSKRDAMSAYDVIRVPSHATPFERSDRIMRDAFLAVSRTKRSKEVLLVDNLQHVTHCPLHMG